MLPNVAVYPCPYYALKLFINDDPTRLADALKSQNVVLQFEFSRFAGTLVRLFTLMADGIRTLSFRTRFRFPSPSTPMWLGSIVCKGLHTKKRLVVLTTMWLPWLHSLCWYQRLIV